jgi:hypothetical protein
MIAKSALQRAGIQGFAHQGAHIFRHYSESRIMPSLVWIAVVIAALSTPYLA